MDFGFDKVRYFESCQKKRDNINVIAVAVFWVILIIFAFASSEKKSVTDKNVPSGAPKAQQAKFY